MWPGTNITYDVPHTISRSAGWMLRWHDFLNFLLCLLSSSVCVTDLFQMWHKYSPWETMCYPPFPSQMVKGQGLWRLMGGMAIRSLDLLIDEFNVIFTCLKIILYSFQWIKSHPLWRNEQVDTSVTQTYWIHWSEPVTAEIDSSWPGWGGRYHDSCCQWKT